MKPKYRLRNLLFLVYLSIYGSIYTQPALNWDTTIGGESYEELNGLCVSDDAIYAGGSSRSNLAFGNPSDTSWNILLSKADFNGQILWAKMFGGDRNDRLWALIHTSDGGLLAGGYSWSGISGHKTQPSRGGMDVWLLRLDAQGNLLWEKTYGGSGKDELFSIVEMPQGGFMLGCHSTSNISGEKSESSRGGLDFWLLRIDDTGNILWDKTLGGNGEDQISDLVLLPSGNILASGGTTSLRNTGEVGPDFARGQKDFWILELDTESRQVVWDHRFGGTSDDFAYALCLSNSGKIYLGGRSASYIAPPTVLNNGKDAPFYGGASDYWLLELNLQGAKQREWSFGGDGLDDLYLLKENYLGQLCLGGVSDSGISGNKTTSNRGKYDFWVIVLDPETGPVWQKSMGGTDIDAPTQATLFPNGAFLFGGHSQSNAGFEKTNNSFGVNDFWLVSTLCEVAVNIENTTAAPPCSGEPAQLEANAFNCIGCLYQWSTEANTSTIDIEPGTAATYIVRATDQYGCIAQDTLFFEWPQPPVIDLGPPDTLITSSTTVTLGHQIPGLTYQWNNGSTTSTLVVGVEGVYAVTVTDANGCTGSDFINVIFEKEILIWAPNVFTPDFDGHDDYFTIYSNNSIKNIQYLQIFDRWGELVFSKKNYEPNYETDGWDGLFRGQKVGAGVYTWAAVLLLTDGRNQTFEGNITVIR